MKNEEMDKYAEKAKEYQTKKKYAHFLVLKTNL